MTAAVRVEHGDCLVVLDKLADAGLLVDGVVTDPPYHLASIVSRLGGPNAAPIQSGATGAYARASAGFMGQQWDGGDIAFRVETWRKVYAVMKPGAHLIAFSATRTYHRMVCAIEDAGFEIRDMVPWLYGTGFPKSHNLDGEFDGWGTALKPAIEPVVLARKPMALSTADNMAQLGTGAINVDACRVGTDDELSAGAGKLWSHYRTTRLAPGAEQNATGKTHGSDIYEGVSKPGRWPANVCHDGSAEVLAAFAEYGERGALSPVTRRNSDVESGRQVYNRGFGGTIDPAGMTFQGDSGTAARFFYSSKATEGERVYRCKECGAHTLGKPPCGHEDLTSHPTVKPIDLMRWYLRMIMPAGSLVLDPFAGTGTTGAAAIAEGMSGLLIEQSSDYVDDICVRLGLDRQAVLSTKVVARPKRQVAAGPLFD